MDNKTNVLKPADYQYTEKKEQEALNTYVESKLARMEEQLQQLNDLTSKFSEQMVTKTVLQEALVKHEAAPTFDSNIEMAVVAESASYAKQLVSLLEQAALNYAKEKEEKEQLHEQLVQAKRELKQIKELKQQNDAKLASVVRANAQLKDQLTVTETELLAEKNSCLRAGKLLEEFEDKLFIALAESKQMKDELGREKEELVRVKSDNEQLKSEVDSLNAIINNSAAMKPKAETINDEKQHEAEQE